MVVVVVESNVRSTAFTADIKFDRGRIGRRSGGGRGLSPLVAASILGPFSISARAAGRDFLVPFGGRLFGFAAAAPQ